MHMNIMCIYIYNLYMVMKMFFLSLVKKKNNHILYCYRDILQRRTHAIQPFELGSRLVHMFGFTEKNSTI